MSILVLCPSCEKKFEVAELVPHRAVRCPECFAWVHPTPSQAGQGEPASDVYSVEGPPAGKDPKKAGKRKSSRPRDEEDDEEFPGPRRRRSADAQVEVGLTGRPV